MSAVAFDTLKLVDALEKVQIPREQARAIVDVVRASHDGAEVASKGDVCELGHRMDTRYAQTDTKIDLVRKDFEALRWIMGAVLGGIIALLVRAYRLTAICGNRCAKLRRGSLRRCIRLSKSPRASVGGLWGQWPPRARHQRPSG